MPEAAARSPLRWWSSAWRYLIALTVSFVGLAVTLETNPAFAHNVHGLAAIDILLGVAGFAAVGFRRRWPLAVALALTAASAVSVTVSGAWLLATASLATHRRWGQMLSLAVASTGAEVALNALYPDPAGPWWRNLLMALLAVGVVLAVGAYVGARRDLVATLRERVETAEREQSARVAQARTAERAAIAREMHDVLAHRISLLALHAGALTFREDLTGAQMRQIAETIQTTAHAALIDLRDVLGVLRSGAGLDATGLPERPQPTLDDVADLVSELEAAGSDVVVRDELPVGARPPSGIARTAYRILQESCTNASKHAPGAPITMVIAGRPGEHLLLEVANPLPAYAVAGTPGSGLGLIGLAERVHLIGGRLEHGRTRDDRFRVRAVLPWPREET